jgi:hypothetical protein
MCGDIAAGQSIALNRVTAQVTAPVMVTADAVQVRGHRGATLPLHRQLAGRAKRRLPSAAVTDAFPARQQIFLSIADENRQVLEPLREILNRLQPEVNLLVHLPSETGAAALMRPFLEALNASWDTLVPLIVTVRPPASVPDTVAAAQAVENRLADLAPEAGEQAEQVAESAKELLTDANKRSQLQRLVSGITPADVKEMSGLAALVIAAYFLFKVTDAPLTPEQAAALTNRLAVVAIIVAIAAIILNRN